ncbi:DNA/RNA non-specific endonuclease [Chitinasiproducens palmae]|nr:DNA/RNA non-specific endonuclease [Chitinasiproducens palmae]
MKAFLASVLLVLAASAAHAADCTQFSPAGKAPALTNPKLAVRTQALCYSEFEILHSGVTHGPLWVAEHLTRAGLADGRGLTRTNRFYEEVALPPADRSRLSDYRRSGYDRGHMSPAGDRSTKQGMAESFSLANIVPQDRDNNRHQWAKIEQGVRKLAKSSGEVYVVTGPLFVGQRIGTIGASRVLVPTQLYKVVYVPSRRMAFAVVLDNTDSAVAQYQSVREFEALSGLAFPGIPDALKAQRSGGLNGV